MLDKVLYHPTAFICVTPDSPRALPAGQAAAVRDKLRQLPNSAGTGYNGLDAVLIAESPAAGARMALELASRQQVALCAFGSLYMVGSIRGILSAGRP